MADARTKATATASSNPETVVTPTPGPEPADARPAAPPPPPPPPPPQPPVPQASVMPCAACGTALDEVQRYCLGCGAPVAGKAPRLDGALGDAAGRASPPARLPVPASRQPASIKPLAALGAATLAGVMFTLLLVAAFGGKVERGPISVNVPAAKAPIVNVQPTAGAAAPAAEAPFVADWPGGDGWTVQLQTLPKTGTATSAVTAAKSAAGSSGAKEVGALDSDEFSALDAGQYVIYSGVYRKKAQATSALKDLKASFPAAKIVRVADADTGAATTKKATTEELKNLRKKSGDDFVKESEKLPDSVGTPGPSTPKDQSTTTTPASDPDDVDTIG